MRAIVPRTQPAAPVRYGPTVSFRYFAYGSNMHTPRMQERCPSARIIGTGVLRGWRAVYDKPSTDGTAKRNIRPSAGAETHGVVYEIDDHERAALDAAEPRYTPFDTPHGLAYHYAGAPAQVPPAAWYVALVEAGARAHGIDRDLS